MLVVSLTALPADALAPFAALALAFVDPCYFAFYNRGDGRNLDGAGRRARKRIARDGEREPEQRSSAHFHLNIPFMTR
jgi:hypothetical protein